METRRYLVALILFILLVLWVASGAFQERRLMQNAQVEQSSFTVLAKKIEAQPHFMSFKAHGELIPNKTVHIKAETPGRIVEVLKEDGDSVTKGMLLAKLDLQDKQVQLAKEIASKEEAKANLAAIRRLNEQGYAAKVKFISAKAMYKAAISRVAGMQKSIENTNIRAPIDGLLARQWVEVGDYVKIGEKLYELVNNNPLIVRVQVSQHQIRQLKLNQIVLVTLATGDTLEGKISFLSPVANTTTRTFLVEIMVDNHAGLPAGFSATVIFKGKAIKAHPIKPSLLSLNHLGQLGVKSLSPENEVIFYPVSIVSGDQSEVWVLGLPEVAHVITRGQGFAKVGHKVGAQYENTH